MVLEHGVRPEYLSAAADPRVLVVPVEVVLTLGALEPLGVQKGREFAVGHLVAVDVELAEVEPVLGRLAGRVPVAPHEEGAPVHEHHAVGCRRRHRKEHEERE